MLVVRSMQKPVHEAGRRTGLGTNSGHAASSNMGSASPARKLRLLALHSFRTSAKIFQDQARVGFSRHGGWSFITFGLSPTAAADGTLRPGQEACGYL